MSLFRILIAFLPADVPISDVDNVTVELFAEHPQLVTPTGIAINSKGTIFVAESHTHFRPDDYGGPETDRILILSDTDGDGRADQKTIFHEGFTHLMDLEVAPDDSLYVATRMDVHRMVDSTGDGKADQVTPVITMETTGTYPHNGISGLCFNADGSLNFGLGENLGHDYTLVGTDGVRIRGGAEGGSTYRVDADGKNLKRVSTGWWNPFGMCVDPMGRVFGTDNDPGASPPCRLIQVHDGADYGYEYRYGRTGLHPLISWTGDLPGNIPMIAGTGEAPCGIISAERTNLPREVRDNLLVACWADHRIERFEITQRDDSGQVEAVRKTLITGGNEFRPVDMAVAPNGDVYVTDWVSSSYQLHGLGRVWVVRSKDRLPVDKVEKSIAMTSTGPGSVLARIEQLKSASLSKDKAMILAAAESRDPVLKHAAIQALSREVATSEFTKLVRTAPVLLAMKRSSRRDEVVTSGILPVILKGDDIDAWSVAVKWIADDVLKDFIGDLSEQMNRRDLTVQQYLMLAAALDRLHDRKPKDVPSDQILANTVKDELKPPALRAVALRLMSSAATQVSTADLIELSNHADMRLRTEAVRALGRTLQLTWKEKGLDGLLSYLETTSPVPSADELRKLLKKPYAEKDLETIVTSLLIQLRSGDSNLAQKAVDALAQAGESATELLVQLTQEDDARIAEAALRGLVGATLTDEQKSTIKASNALRGNDAAELIARLNAEKLNRPDAENGDDWLQLLSENGNPNAGERIFFHSKVGTCGRCHQHNGRGAAVGPSLSLIGRRLPEDRTEAKRWLLETILQPSKDIAPQYATWSVVLKNGKVLTGLPRRKGGKSEAYLGVDGKEFSVKKGDIEFHQETGKSIMPEGLLQNLTVGELQDLFAFLLSSE